MGDDSRLKDIVIVLSIPVTPRDRHLDMPADLSEPLVHSIVSLGHDLFAMKLYCVAVSALWFYDYFLTLNDEVEFAWKGRKSFVFWLFILNRYLSPIFIIVAQFAFFLDSWTVNVCARYRYVKAIETAISTTTAELFLTLRVYAVLERRKSVLFAAGAILLCQWGVAFHTVYQVSKTTTQLTLLLSRNVIPDLPPVPDTDPYHVCILLSILDDIPWDEAYLGLSLAFDGLAFIGIIYGINLRFRATISNVKFSLKRVIQRDGIIYFLVLFSSNLTWLILLNHARPALKSIHHRPAMMISSIMINRITLNLKRASERTAVVTWSIKTFEVAHIDDNTDDLEATGDIPSESILRRGTSYTETAFSDTRRRSGLLTSGFSR